MSGEPQMFRINPDNGESEKITEVEFSRLGLQERRDIQEWIAANPGILGDDLLIVCKEFSGFDRTNERLDLLAVDRDGNLVIIELKRDDTGADAHWQAIKYASYLSSATADEIVGMLADHRQTSPDDARNCLMRHLTDGDRNDFNRNQRIILASHRFAPEVTSAVLWINKRVSGENLITCIQLIPYHDRANDALYVQASTIIPLPGADEYSVKVGDTLQKAGGVGSGGFGDKLRATFQRNRNDEITRFLQQVGRQATDGLADGVMPDRRSRWAGGGDSHRYYHFWYARAPWSNYGFSYRINLYAQDAGGWRTEVGLFGFENSRAQRFAGITLPVAHTLGVDCIYANFGVVSALDEPLAISLAGTVRALIEQATPIVDDLENETDSLEI